MKTKDYIRGEFLDLEKWVTLKSLLILGYSYLHQEDKTLRIVYAH